MKAPVRKNEDARKAIAALRYALLKKYEGRFNADFPEDYSTELDAFFPAHLEQFLTEQEGRQEVNEIGNVGLRDEGRSHERDEGETLEMAVKELMRLDRYEKCATSRTSQAIFAFIELKREDGGRPKRDAC
jgi:hypothetical protein